MAAKLKVLSRWLRWMSLEVQGSDLGVKMSWEVGEKRLKLSHSVYVSEGQLLQRRLVLSTVSVGSESAQPGIGK